MNKKNKNKIRSKPTEPAAASQKTDSAQNIDEAITDIVEEKLGSIPKESDSAIETTSVVKESVQESDEILNDTPKKPKRNKGKKKKQEDITLDENSSVSIQDSRPVLPAISDSEVKVKDENLAESMESNVSTVKKEDENIEENVTANVRKKKNKKKHHEHTQKVDEPSQEIDFLEKLPEDSKKEDSVTIETKFNVSTHEITEPETKQTKKKNKKKKSENSDKADETVICTAAFQKLISSPDNEGDINSGQNIEVPKDSGEGDKITSGEEETFKQSVILPEESKQLNDEALPHDQINESKGKKKNKRDKKHLQLKPDIEKSNLPQEQIIRLESSSINTDIVQEIPSVDVKYAIKDTTPIAKAEIAKPVEKKRRGKIETSEEHENKESEDIILHDVDVKEPTLETEKIPEHICATDVNVQHTDETIKAEQKIESETTIMCTEKSSKTFIPTDIISPPTETPIEESNSNLAHDIKSSEAITKSSVIASNAVLLDSEQNTNEPLFSLEEPKDNKAIISEPYKTVEKKKKKHPKKIDICAEKNSEKKVLLTPESKLTNETILQQNEDSGLSTLSPSLDNSIEISSLKTDELDGSSDVTPDFIHHPLATSQQLIDDNNNMVIREITTPEEKLSFHLLIPTEPIIQNSGETPEFVEEKNSNVTPSLNVTKEKSVPNEPEKTDLKSKMMEVSQDMEELRLSIERSLAELTSMEKSEENVVKYIKTPQLGTTTELKPSNVKDNISEKSRLITENISGEIISTGTMESKPKEQEIICKPENIQENKLEMPLPVQSDDHRNVAVKETPPQVPFRKDNKGKGKGKRKCKQDTQFQQSTTIPETTAGTSSENTTEEVKKEEKVQPEPEPEKSQSSESNENKGKQQQQAMQLDNCCNGSEQVPIDLTSNIAESFCETIENFEDALTSSVDDVNKTFEMIANEVNNTPELTVQNPQINIISPTEDTETAEPKQNPVSPPKNLLGHPDIPVPSNRTDYKKEKNKPPNMRQAKVKIKDAVDIEKMEKTKQSKESQTENKRKVVNKKNVLESFSYVTNENAEYVYKYSFRKVFLQSLCHVCRKELGQRVPCQFCSLVFYCSQRHKDEDWPQHQSLCFAICTIAHLKDHKHIYADSKNITGQSYRLLRMQMIISCEKVLKRKLVPWEQEALLYPRMCADTTCREWKQSKLADCEGCGQVSYCSENPTHLPASHKRWCKSYGLYQKLVHHQQTRGRLEPKLPAGIVVEGFRIPDKINEVLAAMYDDKIDMTDTEYATLTQLATAPLTAAYCHELATTNHSNGISKKTSLVVHVVGAELQFEADVLFKWEVFFLHLKPQVKELKVVLVSPDLNPSNLPLNLLEKVNLCEGCKAQNRRVLFSFQDKKTYHEYWASDEFFSPDIVCAFNSSIQRSSMYNGKDTWPTAVSCILKLKVPFIITSYSIDELNRDVARIKECSELSGVSFKTISDAKCNPFASVRPDRNFITDDEIPLLFKNYCFVVLCGI